MENQALKRNINLWLVALFFGVAKRNPVNGGDVFSLQKIKGHTSSEMTRNYIDLAFGDVKEKQLARIKHWRLETSNTQQDQIFIYELSLDPVPNRRELTSCRTFSSKIGRADLFTHTCCAGLPGAY